MTIRAPREQMTLADGTLKPKWSRRAVRAWFGLPPQSKTKKGKRKVLARIEATAYRAGTRIRLDGAPAPANPWKRPHYHAAFERAVRAGIEGA